MADDEVEVRLTGNATSLIGALTAAAQAIGRLDAASNYASVRGISALQSGTTRAANLFADASGAVIRFTRATALAGAATATAFAGGAAAAGLNRLEAIQDATVSLTKMLGSEAKAATLTGKALDIVKGTPFAFPDFAQAARQLVAYGLAAEKVPPVLRAIADSAAASGQGTEAVQGLTYAFAQLQSAGKLNMGLVNQISGYGVSAIGILANAYGKSVGDMQKFISQGNVDSAHALKILTDGIENGSKGVAGSFNSLKGSAKDLGQTISGSLGNIKAAFARMGASWLKPFETDLPDAINNGIIPALDKLGDIGSRAMTRIAASQGAQDFQDFLVSLPGLLDKANDGVGHFAEYLDRFKPGLDGFQGAAKPLIQSLKDWYAVLTPLTPAIITLQQTAHNLIQPLADTAGTVITQVLPSLVRLGAALATLLPAAVNIIDAFGKGLGPVLNTTADVLNTLSPAINTMAGVIAQLPTPILAVGTAFGIMGQQGITLPGLLQTIDGVLGNVAAAGLKVGTAAEGFGKLGGIVSDAALGIGGLAEAVTPGGVLLVGLGLAVTAFAILSTNMGTAAANADDLKGSLDQATGAITDATKASVAKQLVDTGTAGAARTLGISYKDLMNAALGHRDAELKVQGALDTAQEKMKGMVDSNGNYAKGYGTLADAVKKVADNVGGQNSAIEQGRKDIAAYNGLLDTAKTKYNDYSGALADATRGITASKNAFDEATTSGHANAQQLGNVISKGNEYIATLKASDAPAKVVSAGQAMMASDLITAATKFLGSRDAAIKYLGSLKSIPPGVKTEITLQGAQKSITDAQHVRDVIKGMDGFQANMYVALHASGLGDVEALGRAAQVAKNARYTHAATGAIVDASRQSMIARGGANITWAEPSTGWEAYISGNSGASKRNQAIWMEAGKRLGMFDGGTGGGQTNNITINVPAQAGDAWMPQMMQSLRWQLGA